MLSVPPEQVCRFNPCQNSACFTNEAERCAVSYKCKPIFFGADGQRLSCKGKYIIHQYQNTCNNVVLGTVILPGLSVS